MVDHQGLGKYKKGSGLHKPNQRHTKPTKAEKRLEARIADHARGPQGTSASRVKSIWANGYHRPGSNKK